MSVSVSGCVGVSPLAPVCVDVDIMTTFPIKECDYMHVSAYVVF